jgi:hypothetical protein
LLKASAQNGREFQEIKQARSVLWRKSEARPAERASTCLTAKNETGVTHVDLAGAYATGPDARPDVKSPFRN